jgi:hypothetical protein
MSLAVSVTRLGLDQRLAWWEVQRILDLAKAEADQAVAVAVELAIRDHQYNDPVHSRQRELAYELLKTAPYIKRDYYEPRNFGTFARTPEPDFSSDDEAREDVDPATVPNLPGLAAVR